MREAVILCGGKGRRLRPITDETPKPLVEAQGKALLDHQITWLQEYDVEHFVISAGYMHEAIEAHMEENNPDLNYDVAVEEEPLGPIGGLKNALQFIDSNSFTVCNVDDLNNVDVDAVIEQGPNTMCVTHPRCPFGIVKINGDRITGFDEKPLLTDYWVSMGVYYLSRETESDMPDVGEEQDFFPYIDLKPYQHAGYWHTVNTRKQLEMAQDVDLSTV